MAHEPRAASKTHVLLQLLARSGTHCDLAAHPQSHCALSSVQTDEPLYAHFLKKRPNLFRDEREATVASQSSDWSEVVEKVLMGPYDTPVVMHKVCFSARIGALHARNARSASCLLSA